MGYECNEEGEVTFVFFARLVENFILTRGNIRLLGHQPLLKTRLTNTFQYYSIHNDGLSSAKTMDEKELFIMKTAHKGEVK